MKKVYTLRDLDRANCAAKMERAVKRIDGVRDASVNFLLQRMTLEADEENFSAIEKEAVRVCRRVEPDCEVVL